jgi:DNA-binding winged helix-turn-helix (wHTH) protein/tetratricopeptide (TPR) repeat protein
MPVYEFDCFSLDLTKRSLARRGQLLTVPQKLFDMLALLVESDGRLISKEELMQKVWPGTFVEESNITVGISRLRTLLEDDKHQPKYIVTLHRSGYRFIGKVRRVNYSNVSSLAVLPFEKCDTTADGTYLADSLTESLIYGLSSSPNVSIVPQNSVRRFQGKQDDPISVAEHLGVRWLITGKIVQQGEGLRISVELLDASCNKLIWGEQYHRTISEITAKRSRIVREITTELVLTILNQTHTRIPNEMAGDGTALEGSASKHESSPSTPVRVEVNSNQHFTGSALTVGNVRDWAVAQTSSREGSESYQEYVTGRYYWSQHTRNSLNLAIERFRRSLELDSGFIPAYEAIIDSYLRLATNYFLPVDALEPPAQTIGTAPIDQISTARHESLKLRREWDLARTEVEMKRAVELTDNYPDVRQWHAAYIFCRNLYEVSGKPKRKRKSFWDGAQATSSFEQNEQAGNVTPAELLQVLCIVARDQIEVGNVEASYLVLERWYKFGEWPRVEGLNPQSSADLLLTAGVLGGRLANSRQIPRGQTHAEGLLNGAIGLFEQLGLKARVIECRSELGRCYDRQGMFDLARENYLANLEDFSRDYPEVRSRSLLRLAFSEAKTGRLHDSLALLNEARDMALTNPGTTNSYHIEMATTLGELAIAQDSKDYFDEACEHYRQALVTSEAVGDHHRTAVLESNHGYLLLAFNNLDEAEFRLLRARKLFDHFSDRRPELDETLARLHLERARFELAEQVVIRSVNALESCGEEQELAESLRTYGRVLSRLRRYREARLVLDRAFQVAKGCGDTEGAGLALLVTIEEISDQLDDDERLELATRVRSMLCHSQRISVLKRVQKSLDDLRIH